MLDTRSPMDFARGHLRGSINVGLEGRFAEFAGDVLGGPDQEVVLVGESDTGLAARVRLGRIGFDNVAGHVADLAPALLQRPEVVERSSRLTAEELARRLGQLAELVIVDVRSPVEVAEGRIPGSRHIPLPRLRERLEELDPNRPTVVYCAGGYRSSIAASLLAASGFVDVSDLLGGYGAWTSLVPPEAPH